MQLNLPVLRGENRSGLARTRGRAFHRLGARRGRTIDDCRVAFMMMVVMVMATEGGEGQSSDNQQGEDFTHGHVSLFDVMGWMNWE